MANAKIISFVDGMIDGAIVPVQAEIDAARTQATHDIAFIANNLRHDIKIINDLMRHQRLDINAISAVTTKQGDDITILNNLARDLRQTFDREFGTLAGAIFKQRQDIDTLTATTIRLRQDLNALATAVNTLRQDVDQLKYERGGQSATSA